MGWRKLKKMVEELSGQVIYKSTFERHLKKMVEEDMVIRDSANWRRGKILLHSLHPRTKQSVRMDLFESVTSTLEKKGIWALELTIEERELRNILFILLLMAVRFPLSNGYPRNPYDGITVGDIKGAIGRSVSFPFAPELLSELHIIYMMNKLEKENIIYGVLNENKKFYFLDINMDSLIRELFQILDSVILPRIEIAVKNTEKANYQFTRYYDSVFGKKHRMRHFGKFHKLRSRYNDFTPEKRNEAIQKVRKSIEYNDYNIYSMNKELKKKYCDLGIKQPLLVEKFIEAVCPSSFGKDPKGHLYPKKVIASSISTLSYVE